MDADQGSNSLILYSIVSGNLQNAFIINSSTGEIKVAKDINRESIQQLVLGVQAKDGEWMWYFTLKLELKLKKKNNKSKRFEISETENTAQEISIYAYTTISAGIWYWKWTNPLGTNRINYSAISPSTATQMKLLISLWHLYGNNGLHPNRSLKSMDCQRCSRQPGHGLMYWRWILIGLQV